MKYFVDSVPSKRAWACGFALVVGCLVLSWPTRGEDAPQPAPNVPPTSQPASASMGKKSDKPPDPTELARDLKEAQDNLKATRIQLGKANQTIAQLNVLLDHYRNMEGNKLKEQSFRDRKTDVDTNTVVASVGDTSRELPGRRGRTRVLYNGTTDHEPDEPSTKVTTHHYHLFCEPGSKSYYVIDVCEGGRTSIASLPRSTSVKIVSLDPK